MIQSLSSNPKIDLFAALISAAAIAIPIDIVTPVLSILHVSYLSPLSVASLSLVITLSGLFVFMRQYKAFSTAAWIPAYAMIISSTVMAAEVSTPEETFFWYRMLGAFLGSSVAVNFRWRGGSIKAMLSMLSVGWTTGFVSSRWIIDFFGWSNSSDYWMTSSAIGGVLGYLLLKILFSAKAEKAIEEKVGLND